MTTAAISPSASFLDFRRFQASTWVRILVTVQLISIAWQFTPMYCDNGDNATYYILGKSIAEGKGYRNLDTPGEPVHYQYPVVFPLMLAVAEVFSRGFVLPKIFVSLTSVLITLLSYYLLRDRLKYLTWPYLFLMAVSGQIAAFSAIMMSEVPYLFFTVAALLLLDRSQAEPGNRLLFWSAIIVSVLPVHTRSAGIAFSAAWIAANVLSKNYRYALMHALVAAVTMAVFRSFTGSNPYGYLAWMRNVYDIDAGFLTFPEWFARLIDNFSKYGGHVIRNTMVPFQFASPPYLNRIFSALIIFLIFVGWLRSVLRTYRFLGIYVFFYIGLLLIFHWPTDRYIIPMVPFFYVCILLGLDALLQFFDVDTPQPATGFFTKLASREVTTPSRPALRVLLWSVALIAVFNISMDVVNSRKRQLQFSPDWVNFYSCADWVRIHTPPDAVVVSRKTGLFYLRSNRKGVVYPFTHDVERILADMEENNVTHVVYDNFGWTRTSAKYLYPVITSHPDRFRIVYALKNPDTFVLEFLRK